MNKEIISRVEEEQRQKKQENKAREREEKERKQWEKTHWKEVGWGASFNNKAFEYWKSDSYAYALWYYHRRYKNLVISIIPHLFFLYFIISFFLNPSFSSYLYAAVFLGVARAIITVGDDFNQYYSEAKSFYRFFSLDVADRIKKKAGEFFMTVLIMPLLLIIDLLEILEIIANKNLPVPIRGEDSYGSYETYIGRIDEQGNIYHRK